jgi:hypothetical protein
MCPEQGAAEQAGLGTLIAGVVLVGSLPFLECLMCMALVEMADMYIVTMLRQTVRRLTLVMVEMEVTLVSLCLAGLAGLEL